MTTESTTASTSNDTTPFVMSALHLQPAVTNTAVVPALNVARNSLLSPFGLDENKLSNVLGTVMGSAVDYADLYFQLSREESWALEDGIVKEGAHSIEQGVGVRALAGEKTGFAYSDEIVLPALTEASKAARAIARGKGAGSVQAWHAEDAHRLYTAADPFDGLTDEQKVALLGEVDVFARKLDSRVSQVMASVAAVHEVVLISSSDGTLAADVRPLVRMNVSVIVEQNGRREQGYCGAGGRYSLTEFLRERRWRHLAEEAVRSALVNLDAVPAP